MKLITLSNLSTFAGQIKAKYAELGAFNELKSRVDGLVATGGEANKLEGVKVNGTALAIADKMVDILVKTGSANGTVSVNNADVAVAGLKALAFKAQVSEAELDAALLAVINGKADKATTLAGYGITDAYTKGEVDAEFGEVRGEVEEALKGYYTKGEVDAAIEAIPEYDDTALAGRVTAVEGDVATLKGGASVEGSVDYKIAEAVAALMENPDETMNSIKELVDWIDGHAEDALELSNQVSTNKQDIADLTALVGALPEGATSTTVVAYIAEAIAALGIGDYAKTTEVTSAINTALASYYTKSEIDGKVSALEGSISGVDAKFASYSTTEQMNAAIKVVDDKFAGYYTSSEMDTKLDAYVLDTDIEVVSDSEITALLA